MFFSNSYRINKLNIDALYNRASSYYALKKFDKACSDWNNLRILGQNQGEKLFLSNCNYE